MHSWGQCPHGWVTSPCLNPTCDAFFLNLWNCDLKSLFTLLQTLFHKAPGDRTWVWEELDKWRVRQRVVPWDLSNPHCFSRSRAMSASCLSNDCLQNPWAKDLEVTTSLKTNDRRPPWNTPFVFFCQVKAKLPLVNFYIGCCWSAPRAWAYTDLSCAWWHWILIPAPEEWEAGRQWIQSQKPMYLWRTCLKT